MITAAERARLRGLAAAEVQNAPPPAPAQLATAGALLGPAAATIRATGSAPPRAGSAA